MFQAWRHPAVFQSGNKPHPDRMFQPLQEVAGNIQEKRPGPDLKAPELFSFIITPFSQPDRQDEMHIAGLHAVVPCYFMQLSFYRA